MHPILLLGTADGLVMYSAVGATLQRTGHMLRGQRIEAISALDAETFVVGITGGSALQSFDGGTNWMPAQAAPQALGLRAATREGAVTLANPRLMGATAYAYLAGKPRVLLGAGAGGSMLFRSDDDGIHWEPAALPGPIGHITGIAPDALTTTRAWAGAADGHLLVTHDAGRSWYIAAHDIPPIICIVNIDSDS
jgi:photosystem II stability/assembly factor-like uncharacterized protein